jgi:hypothetical protein
MARYGRSCSSVPKSRTPTTCGLLILAAAIASWLKRDQASRLDTYWGSINLTATSTFKVMCQAAQTLPMPP